MYGETLESFSTNIGTIPKNMPTNFQLKRLKLKLDIVKKPENRVHELTDSNVSLAQICANSCAYAHLARICATKQLPTESLATNIGTIPKNMPTNFQLKRLKLKLDIVEKPENRVHKLTDSNGALLTIVHPPLSVTLQDSLGNSHIHLLYHAPLGPITRWVNVSCLTGISPCTFASFSLHGGEMSFSLLN